MVGGSDILKSEMEICVKSLDSKDIVLDKLLKLGFTIKEEFMMKDIYYVKEDMENTTLTDRDIYRINEKIKNLEKQILNVIEG